MQVSFAKSWSSWKGRPRKTKKKMKGNRRQADVSQLTCEHVYVFTRSETSSKCIYKHERNESDCTDVRTMVLSKLVHQMKRMQRTVTQSV